MPRFLDEIEYYDSNGVLRESVLTYQHFIRLGLSGTFQYYFNLNITALDDTPWNSVSSLIGALKNLFGTQTVPLVVLGGATYSNSWAFLTNAIFRGSSSLIELYGIDNNGSAKTADITSSTAGTVSDTVIATGWRVFA